MSDERDRVKVSQLPSSSETEGLYALGVSGEGESVKVPIGGMLDQFSRSIANLETTTRNHTQSINQLTAKSVSHDEAIQRLQKQQEDDVNNLLDLLNKEVELRDKQADDFSDLIDQEMKRAMEAEKVLIETKADVFGYITDEMIINDLT